MFDSPPFDVPLTTRFLGHPLHFVAATDSTNHLLQNLAAEGAPEGTVVLTDYQRAGRGRRGRSWDAPPGSSLLFSLLLRPSSMVEYGLLPLVVGVAIARALEEQIGLEPRIKWPNDILLDGKKCCGMLIESQQGEQATDVVVGVGLNVNQDAPALRGLPNAGSLRLAAGAEVARGPLLGALLGQIERAYTDFCAGWQPHAMWRQRASLLGESVIVQESPGSAWSGVALDIADDGALLVRDMAGTVHRLRAADVTVRPDNHVGH